MPAKKVELIFHPIRFRIITALGSGQKTAKQLSESMPDVPLTTLYRHLNTLVGGGILKIVAETPIRGTVERTFAVAGQPSLKAADLRGMTRHECEQAFAVYLSGLLSAARRYLDGKPKGRGINPIADGVEVSMTQLYLSDEELQALNRQISESVLALAGRQAAPGRRLRVVSYVVIPQ